ncbi:velvet factor [Thamnocephalis sphaerospora]|uniref:Velvet factor n=1 Tax=Thamnocephalis sphaerospora TaxID=78915 RepID=A0A4P9XU46_9FUNG|nr:velvet factor [Thamnocephalis sphaerospora]|eukprot:RKP09101.1 velvet factor [Thamnocephalis sphaerospora]
MPHDITADCPSYHSTHRSYKLTVVQQPFRARMCGFGEKDRRPVDPPPIVQLSVHDQFGREDDDLQRSPFFVLHPSPAVVAPRRGIGNGRTTTRVMMGTLVSSPNVLKDVNGNFGCFFCFPDLSIRCEGVYRLRFTLVKLGDFDSLPMIENCGGRVVAEIDSEPFTVFSAKRFPGMTESTPLSKTFARQGLKIPIRNDVRKRNVDLH